MFAGTLTFKPCSQATDVNYCLPNFLSLLAVGIKSDMNGI